MIFLERVELLNWDMQANQVLLLQPGVNLLTGDNGSGKTSVLDGIKVALGATSIGGDRGVEHYLTARGAPVAMVRVVASNTLDVATGQRPFDVLGAGISQDRVSLAAVFEATDDGYEKAWYILDGDRSPLEPGADARKLIAKDYRARLERLGLGRSYRELMCTPQGEIAALCRHDARELFGLLYDLIGGKQVLDEWRVLREAYQALAREEGQRMAHLEQGSARLDGLRVLLRQHEQYGAKLREERVLGWALPLALRRQRRAEREEVAAERAGSLSEGADAERDRGALAERVGEIAEVRQGLEAERKQAGEAEATREAAWREATEARAERRARYKELERIREAASGFSARDLDGLRAEARAAQAARAGLDAARAAEAAELAERRRELGEVQEGMLRPPEGVDAFQSALRKAKIPFELLMDLLEPTGEARLELESWLGDMRFAVAVPDVDEFVKAVALAREQKFPYRILAPDVRASSAEAGEHFLWDAVEVKDPRYRGLVLRLLRHVGRLGADERVEDTWRARGAVVDPAGYVVDRLGGEFRGTTRFYLGREALARRGGELRALVEACEERLGEMDAQLGEVAGELGRIEQAIAEETARRAWISVEAEHAALREQVAAGEREGARFEVERQAARVAADALTQRFEELALEEGRLAEQQRALQERRRRAVKDAESAAQRLQALEQALAEVESEAAQAEEGAGADLGEAQQRAQTASETLSALLRRTSQDLEGFPEAARDTNLPGNVRTLETQLEAVRGELERIQGQARQAGHAAERGRDAYQRATKRVFRAYFARLQERGRDLGFGIEGRLQGSDDGTFEVVVQVAVGEKSPVSYSSPALSGGQKAAISILMAMGTLELSTEGQDGAGFFIVDEPFSASDIRKIQELGHFLDRTGGQYLVSMPTTMDLQRCGAWLRTVLTCTQVAGGAHADGALKLAPPVRCSFVVRDD
ncbi:MAG: AAA family ATPase [Myxococcota bacterium]